MASEQSEMLKEVCDGVIELLRGLVPFCAICDRYPASCFGVYEDPSQDVGPACDECCGHGNEDGWCRPMGDVFKKMNEYKKELRRSDQ